MSNPVGNNPVGDNPVGDNKVKLGFFSFTEITAAGDHRAYNEWHQLDHMPEQFPIAGIAYGQRWVCTPACALARSVALGDLARTHYLTCHLMTEPLTETLTQFFDLADYLHQVGRFYEHRRSHLSGPLEVVATYVAPRVHISAEAVPYRPNRGVFVIVEEEPEGTPSSGGAELVEVDGVAGVWVFETTPQVPAGRWTGGRRRITVCYLDGDPQTVSRAMPAAVTSGAAYAGPLETVTPWQWDWFGGKG
jgi:hypothetical protein